MTWPRPARVDRLGGWLERQWLSRSAATTLLSPLAALYGVAIAVRRRLYRRGILSIDRLPAKVVVVGNVVAGGVGKTPAVIAIVDILRRLGHTPGVVSRGYGRDVGTGRPIVAVDASTPASLGGDEPVVIHRRTSAPVVVGVDRVAAAHALLQANPEVDVVVSDDGLQHLALGRDVEVVVFDERGVGNGLLLPAGPLREPVDAVSSRRSHETVAGMGVADAGVARIVLYNAPAPTTPLPGHVSTRKLAGCAALADWHRGDAATMAALEALRGRRVIAAAGIARPARFFDALRAAGLAIDELPLPDHHDYAALPWPATAGDVVVTEKDAVKLAPERSLSARVWVAVLEFEPEPSFATSLGQALEAAPTLGADADSRLDPEGDSDGDTVPDGHPAADGDIAPDERHEPDRHGNPAA